MPKITAEVYDLFVKKFAIHPGAQVPFDERALTYSILGLNGEAGECAELLKKAIRAGQPLDACRLAFELGDVLWYVSNTARLIGLDLPTIMELNREKLTERRASTGLAKTD